MEWLGDIGILESVSHPCRLTSTTVLSDAPDQVGSVQNQSNTVATSSLEDDFAPIEIGGLNDRFKGHRLRIGNSGNRSKVAESSRRSRRFGIHNRKSACSRSHIRNSIRKAVRHRLSRVEIIESSSCRIVGVGAISIDRHLCSRWESDGLTHIGSGSLDFNDGEGVLLDVPVIGKHISGRVRAIFRNLRNLTSDNPEVGHFDRSDGVGSGRIGGEVSIVGKGLEAESCDPIDLSRKLHGNGVGVGSRSIRPEDHSNAAIPRHGLEEIEITNGGLGIVR